MNELDAELKDVLVAIKITPTMEKEIDKVLKDKKWRKSAFIRVAIQKELDRLKD